MTDIPQVKRSTGAFRPISLDAGDIARLKHAGKRNQAPRKRYAGDAPAKAEKHAFR